MEFQEYKNEFKTYPEPKAKPLWVQDFDSMIVHIRGNHSEKLIATRRPNEDLLTLEYRIANDRAITRQAFTDAITNLQRILSHSQVEVKYPEALAKYLSDTNFEDTDFLSFFQRSIIRPMCEAANGLLVWMPIPTDPTEDLMMQPIVVYPSQIRHYSHEVLTWISDERSDVIYQNKTQRIGAVYYTIIVDDNDDGQLGEDGLPKSGIFKRIQVGKKTDEAYEWEFVYPNPTGVIYALPLGGDVTSKNVPDKWNKEWEEIKYFTSYLSSAIPFADECKVQFSDHQGVMVNCSSPLREVERIKCTADGCTKGKIYDANKKMHINCGSCNGLGYMPLKSGPYGVLIRPERTRGVNDESTTDIPVMRFLHPDTSILEFGNKSWRELLADTEDALKLLFTEEAQSGIAKAIDREDKLAWLDKVAVHIYKYLIVQSIQIIHKFRFPDEEYPVVPINLPFTFTIKSESDYINELKALRENNAPEFMILESLREYTSKKFGGDPLRLKMFDVLSYIDPLFTKTPIDKINMFNSGFVDEVKVQFSNFAPASLSNYSRDNDIMDMSIEQIAEAIKPIIESQIVIQSSIRPTVMVPEIVPLV